MNIQDLIAMLMDQNPISNHLADTGLARTLRYSPRNAGNQQMQDYLGPLAAQKFSEDETKENPLMGGLLSAMSIPYTASKAVAPEFTSQMTGTGEALPSAPSLEQILRSFKGFGKGMSQGSAPEPKKADNFDRRFPTMGPLLQALTKGGRMDTRGWKPSQNVVDLREVPVTMVQDGPDASMEIYQEDELGSLLPTLVRQLQAHERPIPWDNKVPAIGDLLAPQNSIDRWLYNRGKK